MRIWFFDFDGALSPIVSDRNAAVLDSACAHMLNELSKSPTDWVAIISSRTLEDILSRVPLDDVIIGGNCGMEWQLPGGCRLSPGSDYKDILQFRRETLIPLIKKFGSNPEIEIEVKKWSVAIHLKQPGHQSTKQVVKAITMWAEREKITLHHSPNVIEIQLIPGFNKSVGASFIANKLNINTQKDTIIYSGGDVNDAVAMWWALMTGGTAIMVGSLLKVFGAIYVKNQQELVDAVKLLKKQLGHDKSDIRD